MSTPSTALDVFFAGIVNNGLPKRLNTAAHALKDTIVLQLSKPGTGRKYRRKAASYTRADAKGVRRKIDTDANFHTASAPGESPAVDRNRLRGSTTAVRAALLRWRVGVSAAGALALEKGTTTAGRKRNTRILARPYMAPALAAWRKTAGAKFRGEPGA